MKHEVKLMSSVPVSGKEVRNAVVSIDGKPHNVRVFYRFKQGLSADSDDLCQTWAVFRFEPNLKEHPDYKEIWKEPFYALSLNVNDKEHGLQREQREQLAAWAAQEKKKKKS
jgi:hypothetical protein